MNIWHAKKMFISMVAIIILIRMNFDFSQSDPKKKQAEADTTQNPPTGMTSFIFYAILVVAVALILAQLYKA